MKHFASLIIALFIAALYVSNGAPVNKFPTQIVQPNGIKIDCFISGDEFYNFLHDKDGNVIIQSEDGYYYYAKKENEKILPGEIKAELKAPANIEKWIKPSPKELEQKRAQALSINDKLKKKKIVANPISGVLNNLVVFVRFADQSEFTRPLRYYDSLYNFENSPSMKSYYREVSYNQFEVNSYFYPSSTSSVISYKDNNLRSYYKPYNATSNTNGYLPSEVSQRERDLVTRAMNYVKSQIQDPSIYDNDNDNYFDNVTVVIQGNSEGWSSLLWPHKTSYYGDFNINGITIAEYNLITNDQFCTGVLVHEFFHSLGAPDFYRYVDKEISPLGSWDVMCNDLTPPEHMGVYSKSNFGKWIGKIPEIKTAGTYSLKPATSQTNNSYIIRSANSANEYFVLEYRKKEGMFESSLPGSGLLVYRVNSNLLKQGNSNGPPDELYLFRPDGTPTYDGNTTKANFSSEVGRTYINDYSNPNAFLLDGSKTDLDIYDISECGETISFKVNFLARPFIKSPSNTAIKVGLTPTITWNSVIAASYYNIEIAKDSLFANIVYAGNRLNDTSYTFQSNLENATSYFIRVNCYYTNKAKTSLWSIPTKFTTAISNAQLISPSNNATGVARLPKLTWAAVAGAATYEVQLADDSKFANIIAYQTGIKTLQYSVNQVLKAETKYYWKILSYSAKNNPKDTNPNNYEISTSSVYSFKTSEVSKITSQSSSQNVCLGDSFNIFIKAVGAENKYQWYKNKALVDSLKDATVKFNHFVEKDTGDYYCKLTNTSLSSPIVSSTIHLSIIGKINITLQPQNVEYISGEKIELLASATSKNAVGVDTLQYQWFKGLIPLYESSNIIGTKSPKLTFLQASDGDMSSEYRLRITNKCNDIAFTNYVSLSLKNSVEDENDYGISLDIAPNPSLENSKLIIYSNNDCSGSLKIFNSNGIQIGEMQNIQIKNGKTDFEFIQNYENMPSGIYSVTLSTGNTTITKRFVIVK